MPQPQLNIYFNVLHIKILVFIHTNSPVEIRVAFILAVQHYDAPLKIFRLLFTNQICYNVFNGFCVHFCLCPYA